MTHDHLDVVFEALADATRRQVIQLLSQRPSSATELAAGLPVTRQAVTKHLVALGAAGLVESQRSGREKLYRLTPAPFTDAMGWMAKVGSDWDTRLEKLRRQIERRRR